MCRAFAGTQGKARTRFVTVSGKAHVVKSNDVPSVVVFDLVRFGLGRVGWILEGRGVSVVGPDACSKCNQIGKAPTVGARLRERETGRTADGPSPALRGWYGAMVARLIPDQKVGKLNLSTLTL